MSMKKNVFKRSLSMVMAVLMVLSCWVWFEPAEIANAANLTGNSNYLFAYFTGTSIEGQTIHLAVSQDGLNYTALRNNEPVIVPSKGTGCVRDPYLWYNENDGYYYILATDLDFTDTGSDYSDNSESFIVWRSKDLVHWYDETMIDVKAMGHLIGDVGNMQAVWAPQVLWDGTSYVVYFSLQCNATSNGSWNPLTIVYLRTTDLLDQSAYYEYGVIHNPGRHVIDADIIKKPGTEQYYMFYKDESASGGIQSIYYMISDNGPTGPYYAPDNANDGRGPQLFSEIGKNLEGCNSFFDDNGNLVTFVDEYDYTNSAGQKEAHFHVSRSSDFTNYTTLPDSSHNINTLSPRHGSVVKITDEEYNRLLEYSNEISSSSFPETEDLTKHLVGRYFTTSDFTYNAANGKNDLALTDGSISMTTDTSGDYYASFNAAGAEIKLGDLISGDLNIKDGFSITFTASAPASLGNNARFFDISNNWSQRGGNNGDGIFSDKAAADEECYLHMSPVAQNNGLYVGAYNGPLSSTSWTWASQGRNYNDGIMHDYVISFADGNMILYIDGELAMKRDRFNMNAEYGDNFLNDNWYKEIGNSTMRIGKSEWSDPLFTGSIQNLCIYDCSMSYYDVQKMQKIFDDQAGKTAVSSIVVPETVYLAPSTGVSTTGQYYVNNTIHDGSNNVSLDNSASTTNGKLQLYILGVKDFKFNVKLTNESDGVDVTASGLAVENTLMSALGVAPVNGYFSFDALTINLQNGISAGETAVAEWEFTMIMEDGSQSTHYAYTTFYAPYIVPVGAAVRVKASATSWFSDTSVFAQTISWISGVHSINASSDGRQPNFILSSQGRGMLGFLGANNSAYVGSTAVSGVKGAVGDMYAVFASTDANNSYFSAGQSGSSLNNTGCSSWFNGSATLGINSFDYYDTEGNPGSNYRSGLLYSKASGNITIDTSRYTNLNQIPNLGVGLLVTDNERGNTASWYVADFSDTYTYGKVTDYFQANKSDSTKFFNDRGTLLGSQLANVSDYDSSLSGSYTGAGLKYAGSWNRGIKNAESATYSVKTFFGSKNDGSTHALAYSFTDLNATQVDKTLLRNLVLKATYLNESDYTSASWSDFKSALQVAADALGDPSNSDIATAKNNLETKMNALQTTVKLDANGGSVNGSSTVSFNVTVGAETTFAYNLSSYIPVRTGYVFKGWATSSTDTIGSTTVTAGLMPTFYAIWEKEVLNVTFDNIIDFKVWNKSATNGVVSDVTETGLTVTTKTGFSEAYSYSPFFEIEPGKQYIVQMDIIGDGWDVYFFFCDESGKYVDFSDSLNRFSSNGSGNKTERNGNNVTSVFTVPSNSAIVKGQIRLDANGSDNKVSFNNIRVSECYDVTVNPANKHVEYDTEFGTLPTPTRHGYDFVEWCDSDGNSYTASSIMNATSTLYLHSKWGENSYTIKYDTNGGTGSVPADQTQSFTSNVTLSSTVLTKEGYIHTGWSTDPVATSVMYEFGQTVNKLCGEKNGTITLYAVWENIPVINVTFDNMFDYKAFTINTGSLTVNERTDTGFTVTSTAGDGNTGFSSAIPVEPGKTYILSAAIAINCVDGDTYGYDMYIHTLDANMAGETTAVPDTSNGAHREGNVYISLTGQKIGASNPYIRFTAGDNTKYIKIRFDANTPGNVLTVNNIRVYEDNGASLSTANKYVTAGDALGTLPTPTRSGYDFAGWFDANGKQYTASSAMDVASTLFLNSKWTINNTALMSDAYVLDFGMKAVFTPLENDTILKNDGTPYSISGVSTDGKTAGSSVKGSYGTFTVNGTAVEYVPTAVMNGKEIAYYHVTVGDKVLVGSITVFPATVVYYEDDFASAVTYTDGVATSGNTGKWSTDGTSTLGSATVNLADTVYGFSSAYAGSSADYSMGAAHVVSVSKYNNPQGRYNGVADGEASWPVAEFTFAGTGFDLVSLISKDTGAIEVKVLDADGKKVYDWIVDTYYGYSYTDGAWVVNANADTSIYQIPVIGRTDLTYGTYTVQVIPTYTSRLDHQKDGAYDFYLDAIRVYNPMVNDGDAASVYAGDGEYVITHQSIRDILVNAGDLDAADDASTGVVYINPGVTKGTFEQYSKVGPKNEVYLANGQSVAFNMTVEGFIPTSVQVSAHAVDGTASMRFVSDNDYSDVTSISHKTTLYYEMPFTGSDYWTDNGDGTFTTTYPIIITNNGDGLLSLCNIKVATDGTMAAPVMFMMNSDDLAVAAASAETASALSADDGALFVPDDMESGTDTDVAAVGEDVVVTVSTSKEVHALTVNGENAVLVSENDDGTKTWSYTYTADSRGEQTFTLVAYNADGFASEETTVTVEVQSRIEIFFNKLSHIFSLIVEFIDKLF